MKFNPQLKQQLAKYEETLQKKRAPSVEKSPPFFPGSHSPNSEKVVGGEILWKPIDRAAAMLLRKAPWWAQPIYETPKIETEKKKPDSLREEEGKSALSSKRYRNDKATNPQTMNPHINDPAQSSLKPIDVLNAELVKKMVREGSKSVSEGDALVAQALDSRAALEYMADVWKAKWTEFCQSSGQRLRELRESRMAFDTESRLLMGHLREVRNFLLEEGHEKEIARLKEFVETCERLKKLKDSGFLDAVADTMLHLSELKQAPRETR